MVYTPPEFNLKDLLKRGVHFGHKSCRWNPKMAKYTFMVHDGVHIVDLPKTVACLKKALGAVFETIQNGGRLLFVGTKNQAKDIIRQEAEKCGQYYVNHRWLGGTLTNWRTVSASIDRLTELDERIDSPDFVNYTKKEQLQFSRKRDKLEKALGGIRSMGDLPDMVFILDVYHERTAVLEAKKLGIPIVGVVDTNGDPDFIDYVIPGNDDSVDAIKLYIEAVSNAAVAGLQSEMEKQGKEVKIEEPYKDAGAMNQNLLDELAEKFTASGKKESA